VLLVDVDVVDVVVVVSSSATTLVSDAKFASPGVLALSARTVSASDVPGAMAAGGARTTVRSRDSPAGIAICDGLALARKPLSSVAVRLNVPDVPEFTTVKV